MALPIDRIPYDLNDEEIEEYEKLTSDTLKKEFLAKIKQQKEEAMQEKNEEPEPEVTEEPEPEVTEEPEPEVTEEPPQVEIQNPPYPTYIQEKESEEQNKWVPIPAVPVILVFKKIYRCSKHPKASKLNRGSIVTHLKAHHKLDLQGNKLDNDESITPQYEPTTDENDNDENQLEGAIQTENQLKGVKNNENQLQGTKFSSEIDILEKQLAQKKHEVELASSTEDPEILVMGSLNSEIAASATKIVQNIDLRFLYEKTKTLWPPEWDFATWITALVTYALNQFHIGATVWQDTDELDEDKLKFLIQVKKDWEEKLISQKVARENTIKGTDKVL